MNILIWSLIFLVALAGLIKSADIFTTNSEKLGKALGVPQFIIGVSVVALGTSFPELMTSIIATFQGYSSIVAANVVGSNIANILLVGGITAIFAKEIVVEKSLIKLDLPLLGGITALLIVTLYDGTFTLIEGMIMLASYIIYVAYNWSEHRANKLEQLEEKVRRAIEKKQDTKKLMLFILLSAIGIFLGSKYTIDSIIELSGLLNLAPAAITISAVAIGTSLPELLVSIKAAKKKNFEMVIGNIIGSNILNSTLVIGLPAFISPLVVTNEVITIAIPFLIIATVLFAFSGIEKKVFSFEGALYSILYFVFIGQLFSFL
ncbi:calcium/sodium antiporter [Candidatus Peregrinibacteria bacterium]|jgi:cation:H+ antiporter|nr:calcium/sodium antiporter [Candidatus Peregrinibacteria bacterium]MBT4631610.1 calcium/sodium antiporter [Candidatus Peregrinibacteria bacterium]MBT5516820.1 calcium/sodium antiporter [Candidatus Peregrinibacteria bacterium]MBT5823693.1 calcium/sodium antiporter [Candidatus Peregrinibacteria bacterium]